MPTRVRSYSKVNLGLAIGAPRPDGFHGLLTLYQTLALHDFVSVSAKRAQYTQITLHSNDPRVPRDGRNTAWKMVDAFLALTGERAEIKIGIEKNLPIQGGMGAGSANAAAALIGLEREFGLQLPEASRLALAASIGSDVPLFLLGGSVLGMDRGQRVESFPDVTLAGENEIACVVALPKVGVSTPQAFREWDRRLALERVVDLHNLPVRDNMEMLSRTYASVSSTGTTPSYQPSKHGASGIYPDPSSAHSGQNTPENLQGLSREQRHSSLRAIQDESGIEGDLAENSILALVCTGIENDFEAVVFPQYPPLCEIKRELMGSPVGEGSAIHAALSGSGSALFGLYRCRTDANAAQQRLQQRGVEAIVTRTMPRARYWNEMFAE